VSGRINYSLRIIHHHLDAISQSALVKRWGQTRTTRLVPVLYRPNVGASIEFILVEITFISFDCRDVALANESILCGSSTVNSTPNRVVSIRCVLPTIIIIIIRTIVSWSLSLSLMTSFPLSFAMQRFHLNARAFRHSRLLFTSPSSSPSSSSFRLSFTCFRLTLPATTRLMSLQAKTSTFQFQSSISSSSSTHSHLVVRSHTETFFVCIIADCASISASTTRPTPHFVISTSSQNLCSFPLLLSPSTFIRLSSGSSHLALTAIDSPHPFPPFSSFSSSSFCVLLLFAFLIALLSQDSTELDKNYDIFSFFRFQKFNF
jgi:hypothetical protein